MARNFFWGLEVLTEVEEITKEHLTKLKRFFTYNILHFWSKKEAGLYFVRSQNAIHEHFLIKTNAQMH